jgi:hypothetical protein
MRGTQSCGAGRVDFFGLDSFNAPHQRVHVLPRAADRPQRSSRMDTDNPRQIRPLRGRTHLGRLVDREAARRACEVRDPRNPCSAHRGDTASFFVPSPSVHKAFDLHAHSAQSVTCIPMYLRSADPATGDSHASDALQLAPAARPISPTETSQVPNAAAAIVSTSVISPTNSKCIGGENRTYRHS